VNSGKLVAVKLVAGKLVAGKLVVLTDNLVDFADNSEQKFPILNTEYTE
jgi:hypothetical protein